MMKNFVGKTWGSLSEAEKKMLGGDAIDARTCNKPDQSGECIVDLAGGLSVPGFYEVGADEDIVTIDDDAVIYDPSL